MRCVALYQDGITAVEEQAGIAIEERGIMAITRTTANKSSLQPHKHVELQLEMNRKLISISHYYLNTYTLLFFSAPWHGLQAAGQLQGALPAVLN